MKVNFITGVKEPNYYRARLKGMGNITVPKGTTVDLDYQMEQLSYGNPAVNKISYFDGVQYYAKDAEIGDTVKFQMVDKDGLVYPAGTILDEFGTDWNISPDTLEDIRLFKSKVYPGFYLRVKYTSVGTVNDVKFMCNLFRFVKTDEDA